MLSATARALPSTTIPRDCTVGGCPSFMTTPRPCWPPTAPLAMLIVSPCLTHVTEFRSRPCRSLPSTLTDVFPPDATETLVAAPVAELEPLLLLLLSEQAMS